MKPENIHIESVREKLSLWFSSILFVLLLIPVFRLIQILEWRAKGKQEGIRKAEDPREQKKHETTLELKPQIRVGSSDSSSLRR